MKRLFTLLAMLSFSSLCEAHIFGVYASPTQQIGLSDWAGESSCAAAGAEWKYAILHARNAPGKFDGCWRHDAKLGKTIKVCLIYQAKLSGDCYLISEDYFIDPRTLPQSAF